MKKKCLFLGYNAKETSLIKFLRNKNFKVINKKNKLITNDIKNVDIIISFGYRKIITKKILKLVKRPILNLHISYLPFNRGTHPNFWSFVDGTPAGVTIHEVEKGIDTGPILFQKKIRFNIKRLNQNTFKKTYKILIISIENLFKKNFNKISAGKYRAKKQNKKKSTFHKSTQLPKNLKSWNINIIKFLKSSKKI